MARKKRVMDLTPSDIFGGVIREQEKLWGSSRRRTPPRDSRGRFVSERRPLRDYDDYDDYDDFRSSYHTHEHIYRHQKRCQGCRNPFDDDELERCPYCGKLLCEGCIDPHRHRCLSSKRRWQIDVAAQKRRDREMRIKLYAMLFVIVMFAVIFVWAGLQK